MLVNNWDIHWFDETPSTNVEVKNKINEGAEVGYVAAAKKQVSGYGMRGHKWVSPVGGLYFSLLLQPTLPPENLSEIPMRVANAVLCGLEPLSTEPLTIKPQNDIVLARSYFPDSNKREKLVGISSEIYNGKLCVGIGINIFHPERENKILGENIPVYLEDFCAVKPSLEVVLESVLISLNDKLVV